MGYRIQYDIQVVVDMSRQDETLAAINTLHTPEMLERHAGGGTWQGGKCIARHYMWTENPPEGGFRTLVEALEAWRFNLCPDGSLEFTGEKLGDEELLFKTLAPFITGAVYATGEDGGRWEYAFNNGLMTGEL